MGPSLTKIALAGKPFSGKSLLAQQLAEQHNLRVLMPQEITQLATSSGRRLWAVRMRGRARRQDSKMMKATHNSSQDIIRRSARKLTRS